MNPSSLIQEIHESRIEIKNDVKAAETENPDKKNTTTIIISEIDKQKNNNENVQQSIAGVIINNNLGTGVREQQTHSECLGGNTEGKKPPEYWVQYNVVGGGSEGGGGGGMIYSPERNLFVKLVFSIVLFMLILTAGFVAFVYLSDARNLFRRFGLIIFIVAIIGMIGLNYAMMCSACTRVPPCNFVCLFLAVCFMSLFAANVTIRYRTQIVLLALMATTVTVLVCLCLACTNFDFTKFLLYVIVIASAFFALAFIVSMTMLLTNTRYKPLTLVILVIGTLLNVIILVMELQMILGGKTVELGEEDYALGAFMLYTSIVDIFIKLVQILGILDD